MARVRVSRVTSASALRTAFLPGEADDYGAFDGEVLTVDDDETAEMLVETYPNVAWADGVPETAASDTEADSESIACTVEGCDRTFDTVRGMKAHRRQAHDVTDSDSESED